MDAYNHYRFRTQVDNALKTVKTILDTTRAPQYPANVPHQYVDKYLLAEYLTNTSLASILNCLEAMGLSEKKLLVLVKWAKTRSVSIRLKAEERCSYDREETKKVTSPVEHVREVSTVFGKTTITDKVVTNVTEYFWKYQLEYELLAFQGNNIEEKIVLQGRIGNYEIVTNSKTPPKPQFSVQPSIDLNISWLLSTVNENLTLNFSINRSDSQCRTPRRNPEIQSALNFYNSFFVWCGKIRQYFSNQIFPIQVNHGYDMSKITDTGIFLPVVPFFEDPKARTSNSSLIAVNSGALVTVPSATTADCPLMLIGDVNQFLLEQKRSLLERFSDLSKMFKDIKMLITIAEVNLVTACMHATTICQYFSDGVDYIEDMLFKQLVSAIGKEVTSVEFSNYMRFHNRMLFKKEFEPQIFSYAVRRPNHFPEGTVSIEEQLPDGSIAEPILTMARSWKAKKPMKFSINSTTQVSFYGERHVHGWVSHLFSGLPTSQFNLVARARQFSSYIVMLGRILTADLFEPKYAMIIQNKDDLTIPLIMEQIPTPKEFRDAIESLSPEQQRFAKAYRSMQLSSTLFGILIIQIKPQLEKLLKLPDDSLTKEIQLTQGLMELFIKYQIPSDLLSYSGRSNEKSERIATVKRHVESMKKMIANAKEKELQEKIQDDKFDDTSSEESINDLILDDEIKVDFMVKEMALDMKDVLPARKSLNKAKPGSPLLKLAAPAKSPRRDVVQRRSVQAPSLRQQAQSQPQQQQAQSQTQQQQAQSQPQQQQPQQPADTRTEEQQLVEKNFSESEIEDITKLPSTLDRKFEELDEDSALRPTIIQIGTSWTKRTQKALLAPPVEEKWSNTEQEQARNQAFDLLDSLSRSGALSVDNASLHVVIASTHCFAKNVMNTVVQDNVNPIEKIERSLLIVGTTIQGVPSKELVKEDQIERAATYSPNLFEGMDQKLIDDTVTQ